MADGKIVLIKNKKNNQYSYPVTTAKAVYMDDGVTTILTSIKDIISNLKTINSKLETLDEEGIQNLINQMVREGLIASTEDVEALKTLLENIYTKPEVDNIINNIFENPTELNNYITSKINDKTIASGLTINDILIRLSLLENKLVLSSPNNDGLMSSYQAQKLERMSVINIVDDLETFTKGSVLDASQGKILNDKINTVMVKSIVENNPVDNIVTITTDSYQLATLSANTTIKLPESPETPLDLILEIKATTDVELTVPAIKYQNDTPSVIAGNIYELHLGYDGTDWIGGCIEYS